MRIDDILELERSNSNIKIRPANEFWADFKNKARDLPRAGRADNETIFPNVLSVFLMLTLSAAAVLFFLRSGSPEETTVRNIEVDIDNSGLIVFQGRNGEPTVVWIIEGNDKGNPNHEGNNI